MNARVTDITEKDFYDSWGFPSEILTSIEGASYFKTKELLSERDKKGLPIFVTYFLDKDMSKILSKRRTLKLLSKKTGNEYFMCSRSEYVERFTQEEDDRLEAALAKLLA